MTKSLSLLSGDSPRLFLYDARMPTIEQLEKQKMEEMISEMNNKLVSGGAALEEAERERAMRDRAHSLKLKKQRK